MQTIHIVNKIDKIRWKAIIIRSPFKMHNIDIFFTLSFPTLLNLNTLTNHGFLPRNGQNITLRDLRLIRKCVQY